MIRRALGDDFGWAQAGAIQRSGAGAEGVIFVTSPGNQIVVKFLKRAAGADRADKTLRETGIAVPDSRIVKNADTDPLGAQIRATIQAHLNTLTQVQQQQVTNQLNSYAYIQLQEMTNGIPLDRLNAQQIQTFLQDADLLQEVGKIAAIDSFLGNTDRLSRSTVNTGNYLLTAGVGGSTLVAIDNEMKAQTASKKTVREGEVRFIMSQDGVNTIADAFLTRLTGGGMKYMFSDEDQKNVRKFVGRGVREGAHALADLLKTQPGFIDTAKQTEKTQLPGPDGTGEKHREIVRATLKARAKAMEEEYLKGGWARLQPALDQ